MAKKTHTPKAAATSPPQTANARPINETPQGWISKAPFHLLLIALVALAAYGNTFHSPFILDDLASIVNNPVIKDLSLFLSGPGYAYSPRRVAGYFTFALNYKMGGLNVFGYHLANLAIHIITAWLVYALVRLTLRTPFFKNRGPGTGNLETGTGDRGSGIGNNLYSPFTFHPSQLLPLLAALLFVAHPIQTQAVTYIVQRLASLASLFYVLSLVCYIKARLAQEKTSIPDSRSMDNDPRSLIPGPRSLFFFILSLIAAILAMHTKEIAATLPLIVVLYEFSFFGTSNRKKLLFLIPILLTILIIPLGLLHSGKPLGDLLSDVSLALRDDMQIGRGTYLLTQFSVITTYIRLLFLPINQNLDYDYPIYDSLFEPRVFLSFLFLLTLLGSALYLYYRTQRGPGTGDQGPGNALTPSQVSPDPRSPIPGFYRLIAFGILWFFITLLVESSFIPIRDVIFEHRLYLPSVGAFIALAALFCLLTAKLAPRTLATLIICLTITLAGLSLARNSVWQNPITLWADTAAKSPRKPRPHYSLGREYKVLNRLDDALRESVLAVEMGPNNPEANNNLATVYEKKGLHDEAIRYYQRAVTLAPQFVIARGNLGAVLEARGRYNEAAEQYREATRLEPGNFAAHNNLGGLFIRIGQLDGAIRELQTAFSIDPGRAEVLTNLGICYENSGRFDEAIATQQKALQLDPEYFPAYLNLGNAYLKKRDLTQAAQSYREAIRLKPGKAKGYTNLGLVFLRSGDIDNAVQQFSAAQQAEPGEPDSLALLNKTLPISRMPHPPPLP